MQLFPLSLSLKWIYWWFFVGRLEVAGTTTSVTISLRPSDWWPRYDIAPHHICLVFGPVGVGYVDQEACLREFEKQLIKVAEEYKERFEANKASEEDEGEGEQTPPSSGPVQGEAGERQSPGH